MPKIAPVAVVSIFEGVGGLACVGTVEDLLVLGLVVRLVVIAGGLAGRGLAAAAVARPCPALRTNSHPILRTALRPAPVPAPVTIRRIELGGRIGHCVYLVWGRLGASHFGRINHTADQTLAPEWAVVPVGLGAVAGSGGDHRPLRLRLRTGRGQLTVVTADNSRYIRGSAV